MRRLTDKNVIAVCAHCNSWDICKPDETCFVKDVYNKLAHYEDLEEQGRLIELPCKVGDTIYDIGSILGKKPVPHKIETLQFAIFVKHLLNNRFFLTKEEAEKALAELKGE